MGVEGDQAWAAVGPVPRRRPSDHGACRGSDPGQVEAMADPPPLVVLAERDYRFGAGPLILRVQEIDRAAGPVRYDGDDWITVHGTEIRRDGVELGPRAVLVRATGLPAHLRD